MLIPKNVQDKLNDQIAMEFHAAHNYLAMACVLDQLGLKILSKWFIRQGEEERSHGMKIIHYIQEVGGQVDLKSVDAPSGDMSSPAAIVQTALDQELEVTHSIHKIAALAEKEGDFSTRSFLTWFIDEQVEEVSSMTELLQLVQLAGKQNLLQVEARVAKMMAVASS